jgi:Flp pilus assembly protein CpaB
MLRRRPPRSSLLFLVLALACGLAAATTVRAYAHRLEVTRPDGGRPMGVLEATRDLPRGTVLGSADVRVAELPSAFAPPGALGASDQVKGGILQADVMQGEILTRARLAGSAAGPIATLVPAGLRAVVIPSGLPPGSVQAGDAVDVFGSFGGGQPHVETVAEGVEVGQILAEAVTATSAGATGAPPGPALVLWVDPSTAQRLAFAASFAALTVAVDAAEDVAADESGSSSPSPMAAPTPSM